MEQIDKNTIEFQWLSVNDEFIHQGVTYTKVTIDGARNTKTGEFAPVCLCDEVEKINESKKEPKPPRAYLNGVEVSLEFIIHSPCKLIGYYRDPCFKVFQEKNKDSVLYITEDGCACDCGVMVWSNAEIYGHWRKGHFDIPHYETIK